MAGNWMHGHFAPPFFSDIWFLSQVLDTWCLATWPSTNLFASDFQASDVYHLGIRSQLYKKWVGRQVSRHQMSLAWSVQEWDVQKNGCVKCLGIMCWMSTQSLGIKCLARHNCLGIRCLGVMWDLPSHVSPPIIHIALPVNIVSSSLAFQPCQQLFGKGSYTSFSFLGRHLL